MSEKIFPPIFDDFQDQQSSSTETTQPPTETAQIQYRSILQQTPTTFGVQRVSLNQIYQRRKTFEQHPQVEQAFARFDQFAHSHDFVNTVDSVRYARGRLYDYSVIYSNLPKQASGQLSSDWVVCDLGARDGFFGAWLTGEVSMVCVSDYFRDWDGLGGLDQWSTLWRECARRPERLICESQNMLNLSYGDNQFDLVISTSVIEHLKPCDNGVGNGDLIAMSEMVRICKPGGFIALSTDMIGGGKESVWYSGTFYYSEQDLRQRLVQYPGCRLYSVFTENTDGQFDMSDPSNDAITSDRELSPVSSVVFVLQVTK
jgi:SAM-dependent methyltransferase